MLRIFVLILLMAFVSGCSKESPTAPTLPNSVQSVPQKGDPTADDVAKIIAEGGVFQWKTEAGSFYRMPDGTGRLVTVGTPRLVTRNFHGVPYVTIGTPCIVYVCDVKLPKPPFAYPTVPPGHCWEDGTHCTPPDVT